MINRSIQIEKGVPGYAAVNSDTDKAYLSYTTSNFIIIINLEKGIIENRIKADHPRDIAINSEANKIYIASAWGTYEVDGLTNNFDLIKAPPQHYEELKYPSISSLKPHGVDLDRSTNRKYVANYEENSISVIDANNPNQILDTIKLGRGRWGDTGFTDPSFVLVNELSKILYVKVHMNAFGAGGGGVPAEDSLMAIDINTKKWIRGHTLPSHGQVGFAFNRFSSTLYTKKSSGKAILKFDAFLKELRTTTLEETSIWKRLTGGVYEYFAEVIAVNPSTNKVYCSDSKNNLLYEIDG